MAFKDFADPEKDKVEGEEEIQAAGQGAVPAPSVGTTQGTGPGVAAPKPTSSGSGNFTNIKKFLDVNKPKLGQAADTIGTRLTGNVATTSDALSGERTSAAEGITSAELGANTSDSSKQNLSQIADDANASRIFGHEGYSGPSGDALTRGDVTAQTAANKADMGLQRTSSEGGSSSAYRDEFGGRALTLAERSAFDRGGQLTNKLSEDRASSALANIAQRETGAGLTYGQDISRQADRARGIQDKLAGRIGNLGDTLRGDIRSTTEGTNAANRESIDRYNEGTGAGYDNQRQDLVKEMLASGEWRDTSPSGLERLNSNADELMKSRGRANYAPDRTDSDTLAFKGEGYQNRAAALERLAGISGGKTAGLGYGASDASRKQGALQYGDTSGIYEGVDQALNYKSTGPRRSGTLTSK